MELATVNAWVVQVAQAGEVAVRLQRRAWAVEEQLLECNPNPNPNRLWRSSYLRTSQPK